MELNYNNLNLAGNFREQQRMVHGLDKIIHGHWTGTIQSLMGAFFAIAIGATMIGVLSKALQDQEII